MSTTTGGDLLERAEILARALRPTAAETTTDHWRSFDATAYRLLHELVGPERAGTRQQVVSHARLARVLSDYPSPLAAPTPDVTYTARQAAAHLGLARDTVVSEIRKGRLPATYEEGRYLIKAADLPCVTAVAPADPASTHPLDRLSTTLGMLADLVVAERSRTTHIPGFDPLRDDVHVAPVMAQVLAITAVAARHGLAHVRLEEADRPLAIARYADHALDTLGDLDRPSRLTQVASFAPPSSPRGPNQQLEAALRTWASQARTELARTIPSTEVLRDIANQARHLYAVTARLVTASAAQGHLPGNAAAVAVVVVHGELREAAQVMDRLQQQWETVTTATRPSHEYVTATANLHTSLSSIEREGALAGGAVDTTRRFDMAQALTDLRYTATDLVELTHTAAHLPEPLIRSELLFAPARILPSTMERLHDRNHGRYVAIQIKEGQPLIEAAQQGSSVARQAQATLEASLRPREAYGRPMTAEPLSLGFSPREFEPTMDLSSPDLF